VPELSLTPSTSGGKFNYERLITEKGRLTSFLGSYLYFLEVERGHWERD